MTNEEYNEKTEAHIAEVWNNAATLLALTAAQVARHDSSKLEEPERTLYRENYGSFKTVYGSKEYEEQLERIRPALDHHYENNRHHPEYHPNGIDDMNLVDVIEMFSDWVASSKKSKDGDPYRSITVSSERFGVSSQLENIFKNTLDLIKQKEETNEK